MMKTFWGCNSCVCQGVRKAAMSYSLNLHGTSTAIPSAGLICIWNFYSYSLSLSDLSTEHLQVWPVKHTLISLSPSSD